MGLRCLIGHDFGSLQTERERRDRGDEVVVTIREFRECARCGERRIVSENTEVRHAGGAAASEPEAASEESTAAPPTPDLEDVDAGEDDGVILEDEPAPDRSRGEWPADETADVADDEAAEPTPWPSIEGEDEGYAAEPSDGGDVEGVSFDSGLRPEAATSEAGGGTAADDGEVVEATDAGGRSGFRRASPRPSASEPQRSDAPETEFYCPECEFSRPTEGSSLRPGDICPECRLGYLTERER
jgi:hypothetical protein